MYIYIYIYACIYTYIYMYIYECDPVHIRAQRMWTIVHRGCYREVALLESLRHTCYHNFYHNYYPKAIANANRTIQ